MRLLLASFVLALLAPAGRAHAYLDGARFSTPAIEGGAGGRYFTGAPGDGYACSVCHRGGGAPTVTLSGVPDLWDPGATYELVLALPEGVRSAGANLEIASPDGDAGALSLVPDAELDTTDRCRDDRAAVSTVELEDRLVARVEACGATRARVRWTAPTTPRTDIRYFASAVAANDSGDPNGDGATALVVPLRARGAPDPTGAMIGQRCSITPGIRAPSAWPIALLFTILAFRRPRGRSRCL